MMVSEVPFQAEHHLLVPEASFRQSEIRMKGLQKMKSVQITLGRRAQTGDPQGDRSREAYWVQRA